MNLRIDLNNIDFRRALYESKCGICKEKLTWEAEFDADGTTYSAFCCEKQYGLSPTKVDITVEDDDPDSEGIDQYNNCE